MNPQTPPPGYYGQPPAKKSWLPWLIAGVALVCLCPIGLMAIGGKAIREASNDPEIRKAMAEASRSSASSPEAPSVTTTAPAMMAAYRDNEVGADEKFKGKLIKISGKIESISKDIMDDPFVTLSDGREMSLTNVQIYFTDEEEAKLGSLKKGQQLTVIGTCEGETMGSVMVKLSKIP